MARNAVVTCPDGQWTELTDAEDATGDVSVALIRGPVRLQATTTGTAPTSTDGPPLINFGDGWSEATIAEKFPEPENTAGTAVRLWARPDRYDGTDARVYINYA